MYNDSDDDDEDEEEGIGDRGQGTGDRGQEVWDEKRRETDLKLLELFAFIPAALPFLFHPLDGDEALGCVFGPRALTRLHCGDGCIGR